MKKSLDQKILRIKNNKYSPRDFIIADAKDGDLAMGITTPGSKRNENGKVLKGYKNLVDYKNAMILGNTRNLPDLFEAADIKLSFDEEHIGRLVNHVSSALEASG